MHGYTYLLYSSSLFNLVDIFISDSSYTYAEYTSTIETSTEFDLSGYIQENYIIIVIPSVFACVFLIMIFILIIRKILNRQNFDPKQLETYSSVNYDDESLDEELEGADDLMYTSCKLLVGEGYEDNVEVSNSEPEYDCMSVDVTVNAKESSIIDLSKQTNRSLESSQEVAQSLKTLPRNFWKR